MALNELTSRDAVLSAIHEYDALGRDEFLKRHGYGPARGYILRHDGKSYDSKAIAGVAYGYQFPEQGPLRNTEFTGGKQIVEPVLRALGFELAVPAVGDSSAEITAEEIELLRSSRAKKSYADLSEQELAAHRRVSVVLDSIGQLVVRELGGGDKFSLKLTSGFSPNSGVRGQLPKDLWFSVARRQLELGMPSVFMIVSTRGIEFGYSAAIHPSDFSNTDIRQRVREAAPGIFASLPQTDSASARDLQSDLAAAGGWYFRRKTRLDPNLADFPNLGAWLDFLKSPEGSNWAGGSISAYVTLDELRASEIDLERSARSMVSIFKTWLSDPSVGTNPLDQSVIQSGLFSFLERFPGDRARLAFGQHEELKDLMKRVRSALESLPSLQRHPQVKVSWSLGAGNWAKIPWIALMDERETDSTQRGLYAVFLFREDMSGLYLTFNQGVTEVIAADGRLKGRQHLQNNAIALRTQISELARAGFSLDNQIDLRTEGGLGQDYEASTIVYKFYDKANLPDDKAIDDDLSAVLGAYAKLLGQRSKSGSLVDREVEENDAANVKQHVWIYAPGRNAEFWDEFYEQGIMAIGWDNLGDLSQYGSVDELVEALDQHHHSESRQSNNGRTCFDFAQTIKPGDLVFAKRGRNTIVGYGIVTGEYKFATERPQFRHVRSVRWQRRGEWSSPEIMALKTLTEITNFPDLVANLKALMSINEAEKPPQEARIPYTVDDALEDLFIPRDELERALRVWRAKKNLILQGPPGVGKSFVAKRLAYALMNFLDPARVRTVQFHQSYSYEDFVQGYRPDGQRGFELRPGVFLEFCEMARAEPNEIYVFIIDEINRGNLSRIFGELMLLIEPDKRSPDWATKLAYAKNAEERFYIPSNVYVLGLMNTADRSLSMVDYALRRRFGFITLKPQYDQPGFTLALTKAGVSEALVSQIVDRMNELNQEITGDRTNLGPGFCLGHSFFVPQGSSTQLDERWYEEVIETEIRPLLEEYWSDDPARADRARTKLLAG